MKMTCIAALAAAGLAAAASADPTYVFQYNDGDSGSFGRNDNGGVFDSIRSTFNPGTNRLTFEVKFSNAVTEGFTLAINNGDNPKGHNHEMALFYLDAADQGDVSLTAYSYDGANRITSYNAGDLIKGRSDDSAPWVHSLFAGDDSGKRTLSFDIDVTDIIAHKAGDPDWTGAQFTDAFGIWLHTFRTFDVDYDGSEIDDLDWTGQGWFDGDDMGITVVPLPGAAAMAGLGLAGVALRRRRA